MKKVFSMPTPVKITGRTSSITNAFVNGIIPVIEPTEAEIDDAAETLEEKKAELAEAARQKKLGKYFHHQGLLYLKIDASFRLYRKKSQNTIVNCEISEK